MHRANGREKGNAYRFKPRARDAPSTEEVPGPSSSSGGGNDAKAGGWRKEFKKNHFFLLTTDL